jgi:tetratricopeptide (TPR) repeat protein
MQYFPIKEMPKDKKIKAAITVITIALIIQLLSYINEKHIDVFYELQRGVTAYQSGELDKAIEHFNKAIELDKKNPNAYLLLGISKIGKNEYDNAIIDLNKAITIDNAYADAYYMRALCHYEKNDFKSTISDVSKAIANIEYKPEEFKEYEAFYLRALAKYNFKDFKGAIEDFSYSIEKNDEFFRAYLYRGQAYEILNRVNKAAEDYKMVLRLDPENGNKKELNQFILENLNKN